MNTFIEMAYILCLALLESSAYNTLFKVSFICDSSVPVNQINYHGNILSSELFCGTLCAKQESCDSFLLENSTCVLNDGLAKNNETCGHNVLYGVKVIKSNVRLCNGTGTCVSESSMGRVEVFYDEQWGSVCDDEWEMYDHGPANAKTVCRMFGFSNGVTKTNTEFGRSTGPIHLDDVVCNGTEASIFDCTHRPFGEHNCDHVEDVGVVCF